MSDTQNTKQDRDYPAALQNIACCLRKPRWDAPGWASDLDYAAHEFRMLIREHNEAIAAIRTFCEKHEWVVDEWKKLPWIAPLFKLAKKQQ